MPRLWIKRGMEQALKAGYLWVHSREVDRISPSAQDGAPVDVMDSKDRFLGRALLNRKSPVVARIFSRKRVDWNSDLLRKRLARAVESRRRWGLNLELCRLVFGESDGIPGLVVDRYGHVAVVQIGHPALEKMRRELGAILTDLLDVGAVYERSDTNSRTQEGLSPVKGVIQGEIPSELWVREGDVPLRVDIVDGQKTGLYLDQKRNRLLVGSAARGRQVLDAFCYTGGFGLQCLAGGAQKVTFVDSSREALKLARLSVEAMGASERAEFIQANVFDLLRQLEREGRRFDMVLLDPPSFAPSRGALEGATRGYREINLRALKLLGPGGILVSSSCSSHLPVGLHLQIITEAAADSGRQTILLYQLGQDLDHPVLPGHGPSRYLKCHVVEVVETF